MAVQISKKWKFVAHGIFKAELNELLTRELPEDEIIILATRTQNVLGEKGHQIRELTAVVPKRLGFPEGSVELYAEKVATRGLCAIAQAESVHYRLLGGLAIRRVGSQTHLPCPSQCLQRNRILAAASGGWMLSCTNRCLIKSCTKTKKNRE
uniref:40S ribosomal protein S3-like n=1 Tax=Peromyscus maniculatus bairdii TaxID=230844 RepID=A0A8C8TVH6_PERMB